MDEMRSWEVSRIPLKPLLSTRGFLLYVSRAFPDLVPYMKGLHATIDSWRPGRDNEGWKLEWDGEGKDPGATAVAPVYVQAVPRWKDDVRALGELLSGEQPALRRVRRKSQSEVWYGFGDASQAGFGTTVQIGEEVHYAFGQWNQTMMESSSNNRELTNLVLQLEEITKRTDCHGGEIFLFTDNAVAESVYNKGNSSSKRLFEGMLSIRKMAMTRDVRVHIVHVAGSQMIEQGTDGLSRGTHSQGVMRGMAMKAFIPLHLTALERSSSLAEWVESWWPERDGEHLQWHVDPADWFDRCHTKGNHVWAPPPAAADVVAEELGRAIHKRPNFWHLILVPRLFTARWARALGRECTVRLDIPPGSGAFWDSKQHEPLFFVRVCSPPARRTRIHTPDSVCR